MLWFWWTKGGIQRHFYPAPYYTLYLGSQLWVDSSCILVPWKARTRSATADQKFFRQCRRQTASQNKAFEKWLRLSLFICLQPSRKKTVVNLCLLTVVSSPSHREYISGLWLMFSVLDIHRNKTYKYRNICFMLDTPRLGSRKPMRDMLWTGR